MQNQNELFDTFVSQNDVVQVTQLIANALNKEAVITSIRKYKAYELLPIVRPLFEGSDIIPYYVDIITDCIQEGIALTEFLTTQLLIDDIKEDICFTCGERGIELNKSESVIPNFDYSEYKHGLLKSDNVELYKKLVPPPYTYEAILVVTYKAFKIMDYIGYEGNHLVEYASSADITVLEHLYALGYKSQCEVIFNENLFKRTINPNYVRTALNSGLQLTEANLNRIKTFPSLWAQINQ